MANMPGGSHVARRRAKRPYVVAEIFSAHAVLFVIPLGKSGVYARAGDRILSPIGNRPLIRMSSTNLQQMGLVRSVELGEIKAVIRKSQAWTDAPPQSI